MKRRSSLDIIRAINLHTISGSEYQIINLAKAVAAGEGTDVSAVTIWSEWLDYRQMCKGPAPRLLGHNELTEPDWKKRDTGDAVTYQECVSWEFNITDSELTIVVWNGDSYSGKRDTLRCRFVIRAPLKTMLSLFRVIFESHIQNALWLHIDAIRQAELDELEEKELARIENKLFEGANHA